MARPSKGPGRLYATLREKATGATRYIVNECIQDNRAVYYLKNCCSVSNTYCGNSEWKKLGSMEKLLDWLGSLERLSDFIFITEER